ncbi:MAG: hypothetical protein IJ938_01560 [Clostridia bacterium]|nr:hypothetical protein [Clostridia bacterium]
MPKRTNHFSTKEAKRRASAKYDKANTKGIYLKLNKNTDADIIEYLEEVENVQGYIKTLIRKDMDNLSSWLKP